MPLNAPRRSPPNIDRGAWFRSSLSGPTEAVAWITRRAGVVYIKAEGEGIGRGLSTATEDSLWKMPQPPILDDDVIRVKRAFPRAVSCSARVCVLHTRKPHALPTCCITFRLSSAVVRGVSAPK